MYESRRQQLLRRADFLRRMLAHAAASLALMLGSVVIGMAGYMHFEGLYALDAFLEAAMLLSGMGPLHTPATEAGKLFAGLYALYSGIVFVAIAAILVAPVAHRILHRFHLDHD